MHPEVCSVSALKSSQSCVVAVSKCLGSLNEQLDKMKYTVWMDAVSCQTFHLRKCFVFFCFNFPKLASLPVSDIAGDKWISQGNSIDSVLDLGCQDSRSYRCNHKLIESSKCCWCLLKLMVLGIFQNDNKQTISPLAEAACSKSGQRSSGQKEVGLVAKGWNKNMQVTKKRIFRRSEFSGP